jgi:hypothetical protein
MSKIKNSLVAFSFILSVFVFAPVATYGQTAKPPSDVNVVNTPNVKVANTSADPVPTQAQGTTTIAGTVQAQQSGSWDVGITGTPTFKVGNTADSPVPSRDVDNPVRQPFVAVLQSANPSNRSFQVPLGKRLVIEYVSGIGQMRSGQKILTVSLQTELVLNGQQIGVRHHFTPVLTGTKTFPIAGNLDAFVVSQQTRLYAEQGSTVELSTDVTEEGFGFTVTVSGYFVDR